MEALLAFSIFGVAVTSIVIALHRTAMVSYEINRESWAQDHLENLIKEVITIPVPEDQFARDEIRDLPQAKARVLITPLNDTPHTNETTAQPLKKMYRVEITLYWDEDGIEKTKSADTIHYYPLHQKR